MEQIKENTSQEPRGNDDGLLFRYRSPGGPLDIYLISDKLYHKYNMMESVEVRERIFFNFVLSQVSAEKPGAPTPSMLMILSENECGDVARVDDLAGYPLPVINPFTQKEIQSRNILSLASVAYCILHDIPLLDAAKDTTLFTQRKGYCEAIAEISRCFPDLKEKLSALRQSIEKNVPEPGSLYITLDGNLHPLRISTDDRGINGFKKYLYEEMRKVSPGEPLPNWIFTHYDVPDISGMQYAEGEDQERYLTQKAIVSLSNQWVMLPANNLHLHEVMYSVLNDIPIQSPQAMKQSERSDYFDKCNEMRRSAPDLSAKLDALQGRKEDATPKVRHVPSVPVKPHKQGPKV